MAIFRGDGGEIEIRPNKPTEIYTVHNSSLEKEIWPAMLLETRQQFDQTMDLNRLKAVWRGEDQDEYAISAIIGTTALALDLLGRCDGQSDSLELAANLWTARDLSYV